MPGPPRRIPPILSNSPSQWINRLAERYAAFAALAVTAEERRRLEAWLIELFVQATLEIEPLEALPNLRAQVTNALREVIGLTNAEGQQARLTPERLIKLGGAGFRTDDAGAEGSTAQLPAAYVAQAVGNACDWFAAESFTELNPIEQAAIVLLRLATIRPFAQANQATALVAASLFTRRAGLPPLLIKPELHTAFRQAMLESEQMNMQPLVELMADAVSSTLGEMVSFVRQARGERG